MAGCTDFSMPFTGVEVGYNEDNNNGSEVSDSRDEKSENSDEGKQLSNAKPPRHLSVVRHSISSAALVSPIEFVSKFCL